MATLTSPNPYPFASRQYFQELGIPMLPHDYVDAVDTVTYFMNCKEIDQAEAVKLALEEEMITDGEAKFIFGVDK